jgi:hypothetical protein
MPTDGYGFGFVRIFESVRYLCSGDYLDGVLMKLGRAVTASSAGRILEDWIAFLLFGVLSSMFCTNIFLIENK